MFRIARMFVLVLVVFGFLFPVVKPAFADDNDVFVVINESDNLWAIGNIYGQDYNELKAYNGLTDDVVYPLQTLLLPPSWPNLYSVFSRNQLKAIHDDMEQSDLLIQIQEGKTYRVLETRVRFKQPAGWMTTSLTFERHLTFAKDDNVTLNPLGINWNHGVLTVNRPTVFGGGETAVALSSFDKYSIQVETPVLSQWEWMQQGWPWARKTIASSFFDSETNTVYVWSFLPQVDDSGNLVIDLIDSSVYQLLETMAPVVDPLPADDLSPREVAWKNGDTYTVDHVFVDYRQVKAQSSSYWTMLRPIPTGVTLSGSAGQLTLGDPWQLSFTRPCLAPRTCVSTTSSPVSELQGESYQLFAADGAGIRFERK